MAVAVRGPEIPFARLTTCLLGKHTMLHHRIQPCRLLVCIFFPLSLSHNMHTRTHTLKMPNHISIAIDLTERLKMITHISEAVPAAILIIPLSLKNFTRSVAAITRLFLFFSSLLSSSAPPMTTNSLSYPGVSRKHQCSTTMERNQLTNLTGYSTPAKKFFF